MSFQGQNPARQCGDILIHDARARLKIRSVIIYNTTSERVKITSVYVCIP